MPSEQGSNPFGSRFIVLAAGEQSSFSQFSGTVDSHINGSSLIINLFLL
jgi:hypothetical protein